MHMLKTTSPVALLLAVGLAGACGSKETSDENGNVAVEPGDEVDLDGDGEPDGVAVDSDGDGIVDSVDTDDDGIGDVDYMPPVGDGDGDAGTGGASTTNGSGGSSSPAVTTPCGSTSDWGPDSRDVPSVGEAGFDPSVDPGVEEIFITDPDLYRCENYVYTATEAGDHDLAEGIVAINYDVTGADNLEAVLTSHLSELEAGHGLALYLLNGTSLGDADLDFLQMLHSESEGLGLDNLDTLHVYNLKSLRGGVESDSVTAYGIPYPFLWTNGWQSPESELMKGDGGWVKHIVMDDLEEIQAGTFCDTMFESMSFRGVRVVRQMGLGFAPRAPATYLYMPSVVEVEMHAFRRRQRILKYNFPKLTTAGPFAFDDNSRMQYFNAPSLINPPTGDVDDTRNTINDPRDLIAFNLPSVEYLGLSAMGGTNDTTTVFRFPNVVNLEGSSLRGHSTVQFIWIPEATRIGPNMFIGNAALTDLYAPKVEWLGRFAFDGCGSVAELNLPGVTYVQHSAFQGATALEEVRLPSVGEIGDGAFQDLSNLTSVYLGDTPPDQGANVFSGTSPDLVVYHSGSDAAWAGWAPAGNDSASVVAE